MMSISASTLSNLFVSFLVAFGMVVGGSIFGGIAVMMTTHRPPFLFMESLAERLKIWAMVAALGGSMDALKAIGDGMWSRKIDTVGKQLIYFIVAFIGCQLGALVMHWLAGGSTQE
ncbi:YtrH family sporulation protein [Alicyclobacillus contaminans]|uniref:YtrH family sporulation protein n=1 Tax=Alicyclobacillus contaminans TaxID=392016 RepID=UPI0003FD8B88|nr:YtrH family sporulation protein [Alicyclobacillus contaminans]